MKWMSLRWSTFFIIAVTFLGLIVVLLSSLNSLLPSYFQQQEQAAARQAALRGRAVLEERLAELMRIASATPADFVPLPEMTDPLMRSLEIQIAGRFQFATRTFRGRLSPADGSAVVFADPAQRAEIEAQLVSATHGAPSQGMLSFGNDVYLAVLVPLDDEYSILLARRLDESALERISSAQITTLQLISCRTAAGSSEQASLCSHVAQSDQPYILARSDDQVDSYLPLGGMDGGLAYALQVSSGRVLFNNGRSVMNVLTIALTASAVIFAIMTLLFIRWFIIRRLSLLNQEVQTIADQKTTLRRVGVSGKDEIARLAGNINDMLDKLETVQRELGQSYEQVRLGRKRLEELSHRLVEVQEEERRTIAMELHDEIGQSLTALKLQLATGRGRPTSEQLDGTHRTLDGLIGRVRELSLQLRPAMLDDLGLLPTLVWFSELFTKQTGIQVRLVHSKLEGKRFPQPLEITVFRLVQESLTNIARHADVKTCQVALDTKGNKLRLEVSDRGKGFDAYENASQEISAGISGMRERVLMQGGRFEVSSAPRKGTRIVAELPIQGALERRRRER